MGLFPSRSGRLSTDRTQEAVLEILHGSVYQGSTWRLRLPRQPLCGRIEGDRFTVTRVLRGGNNSFAPIVRGQVGSSDGRAVLEYRMVIATDVRVVFVLIQLACLTMLLITLALGTPWPFQAAPLALSAGVVVMMHLGFAFEVPRTERLLRELIAPDSTAATKAAPGRGGIG